MKKINKIIPSVDGVVLHLDEHKLLGEVLCLSQVVLPKALIQIDADGFHYFDGKKVHSQNYYALFDDDGLQLIVYPQARLVHSPSGEVVIKSGENTYCLPSVGDEILKNCIAVDAGMVTYCADSYWGGGICRETIDAFPYFARII